MSTYHSTGIAIKGDVQFSPGLATVFDDGHAEGHIAVYTDDGSLTIRADTPEVLRLLAAELTRAAAELEAVKVPAAAA